MGWWLRVRRSRVLACAGVLEAVTIWLVVRALDMRHDLVEITGGDPSGSVITHEFVMRSVARPMMYWGSFTVLVVVAVALAAFLVYALIRA